MVERSGGTSDGPGAAARPDFVPTINEADPPGFVIDGTDSFAVPGPADGQPPSNDEGPTISRGRVLLTAGSVLAGLVFVVAVGSGGDAGVAGDAGVRSGDGSPFDVGWWDHEDRTSAVAGPLEPVDDETLARLAQADEADGADTSDTFDTERPDSTFADRPYTTYDFGADDDEYADDDDDGTSVRTPRYTIPRRSYTPPRRSPFTTVPPYRPSTVTTSTSSSTTAPSSTSSSSTTTSTTMAPTSSSSSTTSTSSTTTTSTTTSSTTSTTSTTTAPPSDPKWELVAAVPGPCADPQMSAVGDLLVATAAGVVHTSVDAGSWSRLTDLPVNGLPAGTRARVLGARTTEGTTTVVALVDSGLRRFDGSTWSELPVLPPSSGEPVGAHVLDDGGVLVGTDAGVFHLVPDGLQWEPQPTPADVGVVGDPWTEVAAPPEEASVHWQLADSRVLRRDASGSWTIEQQPLPAGLASVAARPDGVRIGIRDGHVVTVTGSTTTPFAQQPPFRPVGVVHSPAADATFVFDAGCQVARLDDPGS